MLTPPYPKRSPQGSPRHAALLRVQHLQAEICRAGAISTLCSARSRPGTPRGQSQAPPRSREAAPHPSSPHSHIAQTPLCCALSLPKTRCQPAASLRFLPSMAGNKILTAGASLGSSMHTAPCGHLHAFTSSPDPKTDPSRLTPAPPWCVGGCPPKPQPCPTLWAPHTRVRACQAASPGHGEPLCTLAGIDAWQRGESISIIKPCTTGLRPPSPFPMAEGCSSPWQGPTGTTAPGRCQGSSPWVPAAAKGTQGTPAPMAKESAWRISWGKIKQKQTRVGVSHQPGLCCELMLTRQREGGGFGGAAQIHSSTAACGGEEPSSTFPEREKNIVGGAKQLGQGHVGGQRQPCHEHHQHPDKCNRPTSSQHCPHPSNTQAAHQPLQPVPTDISPATSRVLRSKQAECPPTHPAGQQGMAAGKELRPLCTKAAFGSPEAPP